MSRQHAERQFPDDAALLIGEVVELVHNDGRDVTEVEALLVQQAIQQDFGHDDEDASVRIDAAVAGDEADVVGLEAPAHGRFLHLVELLFGQGDQRRGVINDAAGMQRLEKRALGDERFAGAGGSADEDSLFGGEPGEKSVFLDGIRRVRKLREVAFGQVVA